MSRVEHSDFVEDISVSPDVTCNTLWRNIFLRRADNRSGPLQQVLKIIFLTTVPCLVLFVRDGFEIVELTKTLTEKQDIGQSARISLEVGNVIHYIQLERGSSVLYITSGKDSRTIYTMQESYINTDAAISKLSSWITTNSNESQYESRDNYHAWIREFRRRIYYYDMRASDVLDFYSGGNTVLIDSISESFMTKQKKMSIWTEMVAYDMLIRSKEMAGIERALGSVLYSHENDSKTDDTSELFGYQDVSVLGISYLKQSMGVSVYVRNLIDNAYLGSLQQTTITVMRDEILNNNIVSGSVKASQTWFSIMTSYIDTLEGIQQKIGTYILKVSENEIASIEGSVVLHILRIVVAFFFIFIFVSFVYCTHSQTYRHFCELRVKNTILISERMKTYELMTEILPVTIAEQVICNRSVCPDRFESVTILFSDISNFLEFSDCCSPIEMVTILNLVYSTYDELLSKYDVYKVQTLGNTFMIASGLPVTNGDRHAFELAELSMDLMETMSDIEVPFDGPVVSCLVGNILPRYCLFGDTVVTASSMQTTADPMTIQITCTTYKLLRVEGRYRFKRRGLVNVKGQGNVLTYILLGRNGSQDGSNLKPPVLDRNSLMSIKYINFFKAKKEADVDFRLSFV